jgi:thioredoxin reductase (NADPH)
VSHYLRSALPDEHHYLADMHHGQGCSGPELMHLMRQQAMNFGARIETDDIVDVDLSQRPFTLRSRSGQKVAAHALIIARAHGPITSGSNRRNSTRTAA